MAKSGYRVLGMDLSQDMVAIARQRAPAADFMVGSFVAADLPACVAITAIGEVLNYAFDERNDAASRATFFAKACNALSPGGILLFDVAGFDRASTGGRGPTVAEGSDWKVVVETELDERAHVLTRHITSVRRIAGQDRRDSEIHRLLLVDPDETLQSFVSMGFRAQKITGYGAGPLPPGLTAFLAHKPQLP